MKRFVTILSLFFCLSSFAITEPKIVFPQDEGSHPFVPGIEWWYVVMHVEGEYTGDKYSVLVTHFNNLFRFFTITNVTKKSHASGTTVGILKSPMGELNLEHHTKYGVDFLRHKKTTANEYEIESYFDKMKIRANLKSRKKPLLVGGNGFIPVGKSGFSYYYSLTNLEVKGTIEYQGIKEPVRGISWMDHQWGPFLVSPVSIGKTFESYEWFCIHLQNGYELMIKNIFDRDNRLPQTEAYTSVELVDPNGVATRTLNKKFIRTRYYKDPTSGHIMSMGWKISIPEFKMYLDISPDQVDQMVSFPLNGDFWEGSLSVRGLHAGVPVKGKGFGELIHRYQIPKLKLSLKDRNIIVDQQVRVRWQVINPDEGNPLSYDLYLMMNGEEKLIAKTINRNQYVFFINDYIQGINRKNQKIAFKVVANSSDKLISGSNFINANYFAK